MGEWLVCGSCGAAIGKLTEVRNGLKVPGQDPKSGYVKPPPGQTSRQLDDLAVLQRHPAV